LFNKILLCYFFFINNTNNIITNNTTLPIIIGVVNSRPWEGAGFLVGKFFEESNIWFRIDGEEANVSILFFIFVNASDTFKFFWLQ